MTINAGKFPIGDLPTRLWITLGPSPANAQLAGTGRVGAEPARDIDVGTPSSSQHLHEHIGFALGQLQSYFSYVIRALAQKCRQGDSLSAAKVDAKQVACYQLAICSAELAAARAAAEASSSPLSEVDTRLALLGCAEGILSVAQRLEEVTADVGVDPSAFMSFRTGTIMQSLRTELLRGEAIAELGSLVVDTRESFGRIHLTDELTIASEQFQKLAQRLVQPVAQAIHRNDSLVPESILQPLREAGLFGLSIPERFGGVSESDQTGTLTMLVATEALSEASLGAAGSLITRPEILTRALLAGGTEAQKARWLPKIAAGQPLCAIAMTEPGAGSDVANVQLKAQRTNGGWSLTGMKTWCTFAGKAGLIMVLARTNADASPAYRGLSILLVEKPSYDGSEFEFRQPGGGLLRGSAIKTIGYRGMRSFELRFENFFVPDENLVGEAAGLGNGFYYSMAGMVGGRLQTAARAQGLMRAALLAAIEHARHRHIFDAPLASFALTRAKLARMAAQYYCCRLLTFAVGRIEGDARYEASLAKLLACRAAESVTRECVQMHGGLGYAEECSASRYFVDAKVLSIFEGAEETLALKVIARELLERAVRDKD